MKETCKCNIEKLEADIIDKIQELHPKEILTIDDWGLGLQCKSFDDILYNEFKYQFTFIKRNGEQSIPKIRTASMYHTYCGFCGKPYKKED